MHVQGKEAAVAQQKMITQIPLHENLILQLLQFPSWYNIFQELPKFFDRHISEMDPDFLCVLLVRDIR